MNRRLRKNIVSNVIAFFSLAVVSGGGYAADAQCTQVRVAGPESYPPFIWYTEPASGAERAEVDGVGVSLVNHAIEGLGLGITSIKTSSWNRTLARSAAGEIDVLTALYRTDERSHDLHFIGPYGAERTAVVTRAALGLQVGNLAQLEGLYGGVAQGDSRGDQIDGKMKSLNVIRAPHVRLLFAMLKAGRLDYILVGEYSGLVRRDFSPLEDPMFRVDVLDEPTEGVYLAISKRSPCFEAIRGPIEKTVMRMNASGRIEKMNKGALSRFRMGQENSPPAQQESPTRAVRQ